MRVREAMTPWPYTVKSDQTLAEAIRIMADKGIHQLPVLEDYEIVGILTDGDVRIAVGPETRDTPIENLDLAPDAVDTVGDWMTPSVQTIGPDAFLSEAASIMAEERIGSLPVVGADGDVIGILSVTDVLGRAVAALEEYEGSWDSDEG